MIVKASIKKARFFRRYVEIINVLFNLSNREMDILALLIELDYQWHNDKFKNILDTSSRKYIMKETYVNKSNLSRYIATFKDKGIITPIEDGWEISKKIRPTFQDNITVKEGIETKDGEKLVITFDLKIENNE